jgi:hypothetical protein
MFEPPQWYDDKADNTPWLKALAEVRRLGPREGWCYHHVQATNRGSRSNPKRQTNMRYSHKVYYGIFLSTIGSMA